MGALSGSVESAFRDAIEAAGLTPPDVVEGDGKLRRFTTNGKKHSASGWYVFHRDGIAAGAFGDWRSGLSKTWRANPERKLSPVEQEAFAARVAAMTREHDAELERRRGRARDLAAKRWGDASAADPQHPYLIAKGIKAHGIRQEGEKLLVPMRDGQELHSIQSIDSSGVKRFQGGGRVAGCYHSIGKPGKLLCIAEGYATGASIHEAAGLPVAIAFNAGNLEAVARSLRAKMPDTRIVICADDDVGTEGNPGLTKAREAAAAVGGVLAVPEFGEDRPAGATDFNDMAKLRGMDAVRAAIERATYPAHGAPAPSPVNASAARSDHGGRSWPATLDPAAFNGIAGEFVRMVEPNTEADPAAILVQFLACFGALVGRGPHYAVEADEHHPNLYALVVGQTSKGRKGTSMGRVRAVFEKVPGWKPHVSGLSSGEGVKYHVRDPREESKETKLGEIVTECVDEGVNDKRLLVVESEFASVLRAAQRHGSTLSATIREAWDSGNLRSLTKNDPVVATGAHVCIIGHVTDDELRAELTSTDVANGFANRFLFVAAKRSKLLPFGGDGADAAQVRAFVDRLASLAATARARGRLFMTADARAVWACVYPQLSEGASGLHGAVTARAEAQVVRLALIYALLDGADSIGRDHLLAALAVWQYTDATAGYVFGASLGDRIADEILRRLVRAGDVGLTRTEIRDVFGRHETTERIGTALELLRSKGRAACESVSTGGRPTELWRATQK